MIDPDLSAASSAVEALRAAGMEATAVGDAETGLRFLASSEPQVLVLDLELRGKDGRWLLRRLRDDFMGAMPRVILYTRPEALAGGVAALGVDAVVLKPAHPEAMMVAALGESAGQGGGNDAERLRELVTLTLLPGDIEGATTHLAKRLAHLFRANDCVVVAHVGDRHLSATARGQEDGGLDPALAAHCQAALDAGVPTLASTRDGVVTLLGTHLAPPGGLPLGHIVLIGERPQVTSSQTIDQFRALAQRLHTELAWRSVHERIAADRDRLRESSMFDAMLPGVWTRAALDQTLPGEVAACQRRREPLSILIIDLRGLRHLNERYGHVVGDEALRHIATTVRTTVRTQDLVARYAGDALAVILPGTPPSDARIVIQRIQGALRETPLVHAGNALVLEVSGGVAALRDADDTGEAALSRAAAAMKSAKQRRASLVVSDSSVAGMEESGPLAPVHTGLGPGTTLGGMYQILHEISRGAMGVVYRAADLGLGRPVALKTLRPDLARDRNFVERFRAEAATLAQIRHEHLVQVYSFGSDGGDVYFVMELVEGEPLEDRVELARHEGKLMPLAELSKIVSQIADALDAMHRAGILHRDVKPANVLIDRGRERAVLVDVGIAKRRGTPTDPAGTPGFTAPESFTGGAEGPQADVYGLAATAYTLLTAHVPFRGEGVEEILGRQKAGPPPPASSLRPGLPRAVDVALAQSLDPNPNLRHGSASELARSLAAALAESDPDVQLGRDLLIAPGEPPPTTGELEAELGLDAAPISGEPEGPQTSVRGQAPRADEAAPTPTPPPAPAAEAEGLRPPTHVVESPRPGPPLAPTAPVLAALFHSLREPEAPTSGVPHTRGVLFRSSYRVLGARHGAAWVSTVSRRHPALAQALQPQSTLLSWHPTELFVMMLKAIAQSGRDASAFARELGRVATGATFSRFFGANPAALSPWHVLEAADLFWRRYHTWGQVVVERATGAGGTALDGAHLVIRGGPREPLVCASTAGILEEVLRLAGATRAGVEHPSCEATGDAECAFAIRWQARPLQVSS